MATKQSRFSYNAFISYRQADDGQLATALQHGLQQFARPYFARRALAIFRDKTNLTVHPDLWKSVADGLDRSEFLIFLASPSAAASKWVRRELAHWIRSRGGATNILLVLCDGAIAWGDDDFDWQRCTALPRKLDWPHDVEAIALDKQWSAEPLWLDLAWARQDKDLSLRNPRFTDAVAALASRLHGKPKEDLIGEDVLQHRQFQRVRRFVIGGLAGLTIAAVAGAVLALIARSEARDEAVATTEARQRAEAQRKHADEERLRAVAEQTSTLLESTGGWLDGLPVALSAYLDSGEASPQVLRGMLASATFVAVPVVELTAVSGDAHIAISRDGQRVAVSDASRISVWSSTGQNVASKPSTSAAFGVEMAPDGKLVLTASTDGARLRSSATLESACPVFACADQLTSASFSPDAKWLLVSCKEHTHRVYDTATCKQKLLLIHEATAEGPFGLMGEPVSGFSPDSHRVVIPDPGIGASVWSVETGAEVAHVARKLGHVNKVRFASAANRLLVSGIKGDETEVWDLDASKLLFRGRTISAALSADGKQLVYYNEGGARLFDLAQEGPAPDRPPIPLGGMLAYPTFSRSGELVIGMVGDGTVHLWDTKTHTDELAIKGQSQIMNDAAVTPDLTSLATSGGDGVIRLWDLSAITVVNSDPAVKLELSPDGHRAVSITLHGGIRWWNTVTGESHEFPGAVSLGAVAMSADGTTLVVGGQEQITIFDMATGRERTREQISTNSMTIDILAVSTDGRGIIATGLVADGNLRTVVRFWERGKAPAELFAGQGGIQTPAFLPGGQMAALRIGEQETHDPGEIMVWNADGQRLTSHLVADEGRATGMTVASSGEIAVTYDEASHRKVLIWRGNANTALTDAVGSRVGSSEFRIAFSADGSLAATFHTDPEAMIWDTHSGQLVRTIHVKDAAMIVDAKLIMNGARFVAKDLNGFVTIFDTATGERLARFGGVTAMDITEDGRMLAVSVGRRVRFFSLDDKDVFRSACELVSGIRSSPSVFAKRMAEIHRLCAR